MLPDLFLVSAPPDGRPTELPPSPSDDENEMLGSVRHPAVIDNVEKPHFIFFREEIP